MLETLLRHWATTLLAVLAVGVLGIVAVLSKYVRLMLNIIRDTPPPLLIGPLDFDRIEGRLVNFRAFDGTSLRGMFLTPDSLLTCPTANEPNNKSEPAYSEGHNLTSDLKGVIVFCHEYGSDMYSCIRYCRPLLEAGFAIFTFDFRSHGKSASLPGYEPRLWCSDKEVSDCLGAVSLVQAELEDRGLDLNIGLFGISRGAGAAILTATQIQKFLPVKAVLADSAFSTDTTLEWSMKKWVHIFARVRFVYEKHHPAFYSFLRWLLLKFARRRFNCSFPSVRKSMRKLRNTPIFFIHGQKDSYIQPNHTRALFALSQRPRYLWIVPGAKHNQSAIVDPQRYAGRTVGFFRKFLADQPPQHETMEPQLQKEIADFFARDNKASRPRTDKTKVKKDDKQTNRTRRGTERQTKVKAVSSETRRLCPSTAAASDPNSQPTSQK